MMPAITTSVLDPNRPVLPEWTRWAWASMVERDYWLPLFERIENGREEVEWLTVIEGIRPALYIHVAPEQLLSVSQRAASHGLVAVPITQLNKTTTAYRSAASTSGAFDPTAPWEYRVLVARPEMIPLISSTPDIAKNNDVLGQVLGYPKCCREFFDRTWGAGQIDTTWEQYAETGDASGPVEANILWRWKGIRWVSHLPCSFQCAATVEIGRKTREAMKKHGLVEEAKIIDTVLSWPVRWSSVNGIAEIVGPAIKVSTRSDWAPPTDKRFFNRAGSYLKPTEDIWKQNGFGDYRSMTQSHEPLIREIAALVPQGGSIIDLGCGNGRLLRTAKLHRPDMKIGGVDTNVKAITAAKSGLVGTWDTARLQDVTWTKWFVPDTTVVLYCPVRFGEIDTDEAARLRSGLADYKTHLVYVYGDNLLLHTLQEWVGLSGYPVDRLTVVCSEAEKEIAIGILDLR